MAGRPRIRGKCDEHPKRDAYADFQCSTCYKRNVGLGMFDDDPNRLVAAMRYVIAGREKARQAAKEAAA